MSHNPTCVKITLPMIYEKVLAIEQKVDRQNARISRALILSGTALSIVLTLFVLFFSHVGK